MIRRSRTLVPIAAVLLAVLLATAAAGASVAAATPPAKWTSSVCSSLGTWQSALDSAATKAGQTTSGEPKATKRALLGLLTASDGATAKLLASLKKAGVPTDTGGKKSAATIRDGFTQAKRTIAQAKKTVAKASPKDAATLVAAVRSAQDGLEAGLESVQTALGVARYLDSPALLTAFHADPACAAAIAPDPAAPTITLDPSEGEPGSTITITPQGVDAAGVSTCFGSSAFRSELLGADGAIVGTGEDTLDVPPDAAGVVTARLVCYFPESTGRRVIRGLCAPFTVTGTDVAEAPPAGACPPSPRVVVGQAVIDGEAKISEGFNQVLASFGA